jgi:hypothetical protein
VQQNPAPIPKTRPAVLAFLKEHGFDEADIDRVAMEASVDTLASLLETLALKHEIRREEIFRELERRRERRQRQCPSVTNPQINGGIRAHAKEGTAGNSAPGCALHDLRTANRRQSA